MNNTNIHNGVSFDDINLVLNDLRGVSNILISMSLSAECGSGTDDKYSYIHYLVNRSVILLIK